MKPITYLQTVLCCLCISLLLLGLASDQCLAKQPLKMEILFMNHGPMQPTIRNLKSLLKRYSGKVQAFWFDFEKKSGADFMKSKGIQGHIPLMIYINGAHTFDIEGKKVTFMGFPTGAGPYPQVQGQWTFNDLDKALRSLVH